MAFESHGNEERYASTIAGGCGDHTDGDLDSIFSNWSYLAAIAWRGYQDIGCGAVVVNVATEIADVSYAGGGLADQYTRYIERYDPSEQVVIVVRHPTGEHVYMLSGAPSPPQCASSGAVRSLSTSIYVAGNSLVQ